MVGTPIPFPVTAMPGARPGEGQGDLINCYASKVGEEIHWRRAAGLRRFAGAVRPHGEAREARGMLAVGNYLLTAWTGVLEAVTPAGAIIPIDGELVGTGPVLMAANMRAIPQVAVVTDADAFLLDLNTMSLAPYPDPVENLGAVSSVDYYAGYFIFTRQNGTIVASDLQNSTIPDLSFDQAEYSADALLRAVNNGETVLLMGANTIEVWQDVGKSPFPLTRATVIPVGLLGPHAVAGGPLQWERGVCFVAPDYTVRQLNGYDPVIVSNDAVSRDIYAAREQPELLRAQVYAFGEQAIWSISHRDWTWEYNLSTGAWHRRTSQHAAGNWRGQFARRFHGRWFVQDTLHDGILEVSTDHADEDGHRLIARCESGALKDFPASVRVPAIDFDFTVALGRLDAPGREGTDPAVQISWSHDGGASWSNPLVRSLGQQGRYGTKVSVRNIGRSTHHGVRVRWEIVDPVQVTFKGAIAPTLSPSRARQVGVR